eukprot:TRINITY_DN4325_c0_g2_i1.p1 TRINITY_DN4325_c0_g2~~TRINITY_DN4325_c0_g2_i1.p1  ORF type:complete len:71 (-),score=13.17 TRINITY_DN4325_c0_g2_i1:15-227(-)
MCKNGRGKEVVVLEKAGAVGGNAYSYPLPGGGYYDMGVIELFGWYESLKEVSSELGLRWESADSKVNLWC